MLSALVSFASFAFLIQGSPPGAPARAVPDLRGALSVAWLPRDGTTLVLGRDGRTLWRFDPGLRPAGERRLEGEFRRVASWAGGWVLQNAAGGAARLAAFEAPLDPLPLPPGDDIFAQPPFETRGPAGRLLRLDAARGFLEFSAAPWEHLGEVEWGPGRATFRARAARVLAPHVEWRADGGPVQSAALVTDRGDPLLQRAFLEPLRSGSVLRLRCRPPLCRWPAAEWTEWVELAVPDVEPGGARPVTVLPPPAWTP